MRAGAAELSTVALSGAAPDLASLAGARTACRPAPRAAPRGDTSVPLPPCDQPFIPRRMRSQPAASVPAASVPAAAAAAAAASRAAPATLPAPIFPQTLSHPLHSIPAGPRSLGSQGPLQPLQHHPPPGDEMVTRSVGQHHPHLPQPYSHHPQQAEQQWTPQQHRHHKATLKLHALLQDMEPATRDYVLNNLHLLGPAEGGSAGPAAPSCL